MSRNIITKISINNFRHHSKYVEYDIKNKCVAIIGKNGSGKTTILEAFSLFMPGRGMRASNLYDICHIHGGSNNKLYHHWEISLLLDVQDHSIEFDKLYHLCHNANFEKLICRFEKGKKIIIDHDGNKINNIDISNKLRINWLSPEVENIFRECAQNRRNYFDRIVYTIFPNHAAITNRYQKLMRSRMELIRNQPHQTIWLDVIERQIAEIMFNITLARIQTIDILNDNIANLAHNFVYTKIEINCSLASILYEFISLDNNSNLQQDMIDIIIAKFAEKLESKRNIDSISNRSNFGTHKAKYDVFMVKNIEKSHMESIKIEQCSTGEQKIAMTAIFLAGIQGACKFNPAKNFVILLDDICAHLDQEHQENLANFLRITEQQIFITGCNELSSSFCDKLSPLHKIYL